MLNLLRRLAPTKLLLLNVDRIEMIILTIGLELIRQAFNHHMRGILLNSADRLDHLLNMCKAAFLKDVLPEMNNFHDVQKSRITVWNDSEEEKEEFLRSHLVHHETVMTVGFGLNVLQKRGWNGLNLEGIKVTDREMKKRLRVVMFNDDLEIKFTAPIFNTEKGTFCMAKAEISYTGALDQPLLPIQKENTRRTMIR